MGRNWIRKIELSVGESIKIDGNLRIKFIIYQQVIDTPNSAWFRIYNLNLQTGSRIIKMVGETVTMEAGYQGDSGEIYKGEIVYAINGRETPTDTYVDIYCADGSKAVQRSTISKTFDPGSKQKDVVDEIAKGFQQFGIQKGKIKGLSNEPYQKAFTAHGMGRDYLHMFAHSNNQHWYIYNQKLYMIPNDDEGEGSIELNENTGLIGMPQETPKGIIVTALINPKYKLDTRLIINEKSINRGAWDLSYFGVTQSASNYSRLGTDDGNYTIDSVEWRGDTHGQDWYAIMACHGSKTGGPINPKAIPHAYENLGH